MENSNEAILLELEKVKNELAEIRKLVSELHTVQTGILYKPQKKKPTKKQIEEAEFQKLRSAAHIRVLNKSYS